MKLSRRQPSPQLILQPGSHTFCSIPSIPQLSFGTRRVVPPACSIQSWTCWSQLSIERCHRYTICALYRCGFQHGKGASAYPADSLRMCLCFYFLWLTPFASFFTLTSYVQERSLSLTKEFLFAISPSSLKACLPPSWCIHLYIDFMSTHHLAYQNYCSFTHGYQDHFQPCHPGPTGDHSEKYSLI